jgi:hypothetical protein
LQEELARLMPNKESDLPVRGRFEDFLFKIGLLVPIAVTWIPRTLQAQKKRRKEKLFEIGWESEIKMRKLPK